MNGEIPPPLPTTLPPMCAKLRLAYLHAEFLSFPSKNDLHSKPFLRKFAVFLITFSLIKSKVNFSLSCKKMNVGFSFIASSKSAMRKWENVLQWSRKWSSVSIFWGQKGQNLLFFSNSMSSFLYHQFMVGESKLG